MERHKQRRNRERPAIHDKTVTGARKTANRHGASAVLYKRTIAETSGRLIEKLVFEFTSSEEPVLTFTVAGPPPSEAAFVARTVPALIANWPVNVFAPARITVPGPFLMIACAPPSVAETLNVPDHVSKPLDCNTAAGEALAIVKELSENIVSHATGADAVLSTKIVFGDSETGLMSFFRNVKSAA